MCSLLTLCCRSVRKRPALPLLTLLTLLLFIGGARAQVPELFTPIPANQLLAATPDQNQAIEKIRLRPTTQSLDLVQVDVGALRGDSTRLSIPNAPALTLSRRSEDVRSPGDFTYYGTLSGVPGQATLVVRDGNITGSIQDQGALYRIEPVGNGVHAVIKVDQGRFPPEHPPSFEQKERRGDIQAPPTTQDIATSDALVGIDVLVAYTTGARNAVSDINATIQLAVAEANQSYLNSGINLRLRLVDSFEVAYSETGKTFDQILADFVANTTVQNRRNTSGADLAAMIINQTDFCGLADAIMANASTAFAVVHYDCATGYYSFAHELGHLQGARHDPANDSTSTPFAYGHGYQHLSSPVWRTIMAYNCQNNCPRLQYWSNPNVQYGGVAMGTAATNDNARVLNATAKTVAAFRSAKLGFESGIDRPGADYKNFNLAQADPNLCLASCAGEAQCEAWTYVNPGVQGPQARCWLKISVPPATANTCCTSGVKAAEYSIDRPGSDYKNFNLTKADPNLCLASCAGEAQCKAWTYVNPGVQGPQARCWLKNSVPPATANSCCTSGVKAVEYSIDRPGSDYKNFDLAKADPNLCLTSCVGEGQCKAWTYVNPGVQGPQARCWLKNSIPAAVANSCCTSGVKAVEYSIDRPGLDYKNFDLAKADPNLCLTSCAGEAQCKAWTYVNPGVQGPQARCWLKSSVPSPTANACCDSGVR
jgi:hypothetical protein